MNIKPHVLQVKLGNKYTHLIFFFFGQSVFVFLFEYITFYKIAYEED